MLQTYTEPAHEVENGQQNDKSQGRLKNILAVLLSYERDHCTENRENTFHHRRSILNDKVYSFDYLHGILNEYKYIPQGSRKKVTCFNDKIQHGNPPPKKSWFKNLVFTPFLTVISIVI